MKAPLISIVVTGHGSGLHTESLIRSLGTQRRYVPAPHSRDPKVMCPFAATEPLDLRENTVELILSWDGECPYVAPNLAEKMAMSVTIIDNKQQGGCGHHTRGPGIAIANGSWIYLQNCDNVLVDGWFDYIYKALKDPKIGGIYWNAINNLWGWTDLGGSEMKRGQIDLSCAVFRAEYVKKVGFPFTEYDGDFDYLYACNEAVLKSGKIVRQFGATLCVHN